MPEDRIDMTQGDQITLEMCLDLGWAHKQDRVKHHPKHKCEGEMHVIASTGMCLISSCKTCGMNIRTTVSSCNITTHLNDA